jgi:acetoin utilization deacetylase AcuC-like enzyme
VKYVYSPLHAHHAPEFETEAGVPVPIYESPRRAEVIREALENAGGFDLIAPSDHGLGPIEAVHDRDLLRYLETASKESRDASTAGAVVPDTIPHFALRAGMGPGREPVSLEARRGYFCFDTATPIVEATYSAARAAVDVALTATDLVLGGEARAYGLCRPPGHHAATAVCGGYCYLNNAAIAADYAVAQTGERVAVLDVDYHHGNGTQQIFYERGDVLFVSLHADPGRAYPYFTGWADESGTGRGAGANLNFPLPEACRGEEFFSALERGLEAIESHAAALTVVSLGVDTYAGDPISDFELTTEDQFGMGERVGRACPRTIILQEGGYDIDALGANVLAWLSGVDGRLPTDSAARSNDGTSPA